jgi:N-acetylglucosamine kinase-like BadF-type ATPase
VTEPAYFAGIDGGGTKTLAVVVDQDGNEVGRASAGGSNLSVIGVDRAAQEIETALTSALAGASGGLPIRAIWAGLAGVDHTGTHDLMLPPLRRLAHDVRLGNDAELVLTALPSAAGVALIAGTGSIAFGRDATGKMYRAGGWGHIIGDEGSGYDLGRQALKAATRVADRRGPDTSLLDAIMVKWNLQSPWEMIDRVYLQSDKAAIASLSALVFDAARKGDAVARRIVRKAADELALDVLTVGENLTFDGLLPVAVAGGLMTHETDFRRGVVRRIRRQRDVAEVAVVVDSALSAARAARDLAPARTSS